MEDNKLENEENISEIERILRLPCCGVRIKRYLGDEIREKYSDSSWEANKGNYDN